MLSITQTIHALTQRRRRRRPTLPWAELEAEAARQGCSAADIFFDRAGRASPHSPASRDAGAAQDPDRAFVRREHPAPDQPNANYDTWGRRA
jgi:hypothetical protein